MEVPEPEMCGVTAEGVVRSAERMPKVERLKDLKIE